MGTKRQEDDRAGQHEQLCERCGRCCVEKLRLDDGTVVATDIPCQHLDPETRLCRIYETRHVKQMRCLSVADGIRAQAFPADCPYVRDLHGYEPYVPISAYDAQTANLLRFLARCGRASQTGDE